MHYNSRRPFQPRTGIQCCSTHRLLKHWTAERLNNGKINQTGRFWKTWLDDWIIAWMHRCTWWYTFRLFSILMKEKHHRNETTYCWKSSFGLTSYQLPKLKQAELVKLVDMVEKKPFLKYCCKCSKVDVFLRTIALKILFCDSFNKAGRKSCKDLPGLPVQPVVLFSLIAAPYTTKAYYELNFTL